jgi:hypothetical protein
MQSAPYALVLVAALGYFVDIYDILLFNIVRSQPAWLWALPMSQIISGIGC